jgi:hypothetical protein
MGSQVSHLCGQARSAGILPLHLVPTEFILDLNRGILAPRPSMADDIRRCSGELYLLRVLRGGVRLPLEIPTEFVVDLDRGILAPRSSTANDLGRCSGELYLLLRGGIVAHLPLEIPLPGSKPLPEDPPDLALP